MTTEFDDLFSTEEIERSKALNEGRAILNQTEEILDHIAGRYREIPFHSDTVSNADELRKVFEKSASQVPVGNTGYEAAPRYADDPLAALMDESDTLATRELLKRESQSRSESRHFQPIVKIVAKLRSDLLKKGYRVEDRDENWAAIVKSAMDFVEREVNA